MKALLKYYPYIVAFLTIICFLLLFIESVPYLRFIIVHLRINILLMQVVLCVAWIPLLFERGYLSNKLMIVALLLSIVGESTAKTTLGIYRELRNIVHNPFISYDQKMANSYKGFYKAMKEVVKLTPESSTIIIPPRANPWEFEGNVAMVSYFLYPRKIIGMGLNASKIPRVDGASYLLIARGGSVRNGQIDYGWPKIPVEAKTLWQIDVNNNTNFRIEKNYNPQIDKWDWGLIEVKNE